MGVCLLRDFYYFYTRLNDERSGLVSGTVNIRISLMARKLYTNQVKVGG